jgi:hypothetical protein
MSRMHRYLLGPRAALVGLLALLLTAGTATASTYTITLDGTPLTMTTTTVGEKATASFVGTAGHRLSVRVSSATIQSYTISVKNPDGTTLKSAGPWNVTGGFLGPVTLATTGTYKIVIAPSSTYKGRAVVLAYDVPPDATGAIATDGTTATQTYTTPGQNGTLTFSATAGQRISLMAGGGSTTARNVTVSIKSPTNAIVLAATPVGTTGLFFGPLTLTETGTYTITANPPKTTTGSTDYQLWIVPPDQTGTLTIGGGNQVLTFAAAGQNASLTFTGTAAQKLTLSVAASLSGGGATVKVRKPDNTVLSTLAVTNAGTLMEPTTLATTGTYTVTVDPTNQNVGTVTLNLYSSPADLSGSLTSGTPTTLNLATIGQNASYTVTGTSGQYLALRFANDSISSTSVSVKTPSATTLIAATTFNASGKFFDGVVLPATGTYTISINPQSVATGSVDVTAYVYTNPTPYTAVLGTPLTVTTLPGQNVAITFTAPAAPNKVSILLNGITDGTTGSSGITATLSKAGVTVSSFTFGNSDKFVEPMTLTAGAAYKLLLDPAGSNAGSITTTVYSVPPDASFPALTLGTPTAISVAIPGQNMTTTFTGTLGHSLSLWFDTNTIGNPISSPTVVTLTSPTNATVYTYNLYQHDSMVEPVVLPANGVYTLSFNPNGANLGSFNVTAYDVPADATATATMGGPTVTATTTVPGQNAQFTVVTTSAAQITISFDVSSATNAFISVWKAGVLVKAASSFSSTPGDTVSFTPAAGTNTYVIKVDPTVNNVGDYVISVAKTVPGRRRLFGRRRPI